MKLVREKTKQYKRPAVIAAMSLGAVGILGLWVAQIYVMTKDVSFTDVASTAQEAKSQIQDGVEYSQQLQPIDAVPIPEVLTQFQESAQAHIQQQIMTQKAAAAMIEELETQQEQVLDQTYAEEIE